MEKVKDERKKKKKKGNGETVRRDREIERRDREIVNHWAQTPTRRHHHHHHTDATQDRRVCSHTPSSSFIITLSCRRHPHEPHLVVAASCLSLHRYLIYDHFLQNLIKCLWISESNNLCLWSVCIFTDYWCWWLWIESVLRYVVFFFFFWLFGFVTLCHFVFVTLSLVLYR